MYNVYSVSNTTNNTVLEIKEILDKLMRKYSKNIYKQIILVQFQI